MTPVQPRWSPLARFPFTSFIEMIDEVVCGSQDSATDEDIKALVRTH